MKKILILCLVFSMLIAIFPIRVNAIKSSPTLISLGEKVTEKLDFFDPTPSFVSAGTLHEISVYVYKMGAIIAGEIDTAQASVWYIILRDMSNANVTYSAINGGKEFAIPASVPKDGKYKLVATDSLTSPTWTLEQDIYIEYNIKFRTVDITRCPNASTVEGNISVGNGVPPTTQLAVSVVYPNGKIASQYTIPANSSGQFAMTFQSIPDYGYYYVYISDGYPSISPDNDAIIYLTSANFSTIQWTLSELVPNAPLYNDEEANLNQSIVLMLKDSDGKFITGKKDRFVVSLSWSGYTIKEISEGIYKIYGGHLTGYLVSIYVQDLILSNTITKNLQRLTYFNPYIQIDAVYANAPYGTGPYYDYTLGKNVFDKLPLANGTSLEMTAGAYPVPNIPDPQSKNFTLKDNYYIYKTTVTFSPSLESHKIGQDSTSTWNDPSANLFTKPIYFVKDSASASVSVQSIIWKRANQDTAPTWRQIAPDALNACCAYKTSQTFDITGSEVTECDVKIEPTLFTINETKDLSIEYASPNNIIHIYMVNEGGAKFENAINISSKNGLETKTLTDLWYNPLHITGTNIPDLPINFGYDDTLDIKYVSGSVIFSKVSFNAITDCPFAKNRIVVEIFSKVNNTYPLCAIIDGSVPVLPITTILQGSYKVISFGGAATDRLLAGLNEPIIINANFTFSNLSMDIQLNGKSLDTYGIGYYFQKIADSSYKIIFDKSLPYDENYSPNILSIKMEAFSNDLAKRELLSLNINSAKMTKDDEPPQIEIISPLNNSIVNSKTIKVKGVAKDNIGIGSVKVNGNVVLVNDDGSFEYDLALNEGTNLITIIASDISNNSTTLEINVILDSVPPAFTFDVPSITTQNELTIKGTTEKDAKVFFRETELTNQDGNFSVKVPLLLGTNAFFFTFVDQAGNKSKTTITIIRKEMTTIVLSIGKPTMFVNSTVKEIDPGRGTVPLIKNGRTLIPIRAIAESLKGGVLWDNKEQKVTVTLGSAKVELWIGKNTSRVNGIDTPIDAENSKVVPEIINGRTMLPLRFVAEALGCDIKWDDINKVITITYIR